MAMHAMVASVYANISFGKKRNSNDQFITLFLLSTALWWTDIVMLLRSKTSANKGKNETRVSQKTRQIL